jgi:hypothetical protein
MTPAQLDEVDDDVLDAMVELMQREAAAIRDAARPS